MKSSNVKYSNMSSKSKNKNTYEQYEFTFILLLRNVHFDQCNCY